MKCEICGQRFNDTIDGLVQKTFHDLIHESNKINK